MRFACAHCPPIHCHPELPEDTLRPGYVPDAEDALRAYFRKPSRVRRRPSTVVLRNALDEDVRGGSVAAHSSHQLAWVFRASRRDRRRTLGLR